MTKKWFFFAIIAMLSVGLAFYACSNDDDDPCKDCEFGCEDGKCLPEPDLNDPSLVAKDNLIAYFPFEGDGKCEKSGITPSNASTTPVTFPAGRRGKCFQGTDAATSGLLYALPAGNKLRDLKAFTVAFWAKMVPNTVATTDAPEQMIFQIDGIEGDWVWGNLYFLQHRNWPEGETEKDRKFSEMDCVFYKYDDAVDWKRQRGNDWFLDVTVSQWRHIICTYDNVTSKFHAYVNGVHITAFDGTDYAGVDRKQSEDGPALGDLKFKNAENFAIGAWIVRLQGNDLLEENWAAPYRGQLDELRIYDRGLTAEEAKALYDAEVAQIN